MFNKDLVKGNTENLKSLLELYARTEPLAQICLNNLADLLEHAIQGRIDEPLKIVPSAREMFDSELSSYRDLVNAYGNFAFD